MESTWQDLRHSFRMMRKNPGFAIVAVVVLSLGIGANTAIFSVVSSVLLRPLPFPEPERIVMVFENNLAKGWDDFMVSPPNFIDWREQNHVFESVAAFRTGPLNLAGGLEPERVLGARISQNLFELLRAKVFLGRTFSTEEDLPGGDRVIIISYGLWQRRFGGDPSLIDQPIWVNGRSSMVVGVMPQGFQFPSRAEAWVPMAFNADDLRSRGAHFISVVARLRPGVSPQVAQADVDNITAGLQERYPRSNAGWGAKVTPLLEVTVGKIRPALMILLGAVVLVLLIACANVSNLLLARATARRKEIGVRTALGATRRRLIRQLLTESLVLSLVSGLLGLVLAFWGVKLIVSISPESIPRSDQIAIDGRVLGVSMLVSVLAGIVFGTFPALQTSKLDLSDTLKETARSSSGGRGARIARNLLVVLEVSVSFALLVSAGLLIRSFLRVFDVDPGFRSENLVTMQMSLPQAKYPKAAQQTAFLDQVLDRIKSLPGMDAAAATSTLPFVGDYINSFTIDGPSTLAPNELASATYYSVTPEYFDAMGIPLVKGRYFNQHDAESAARVVIISETLAQRYFQKDDPVGRQIRINDGAKIAREIIGVVGDVKQHGLESATTSQLYEPYAQAPLSSFTLTLRTSSNPENLAPVIRSQIYAADPEQAVANLKTLNQIVSDSVASRRLTMFLLTVFAAIAVTLAAVGLYGVLAYSVTHRAHEIGIRIALGAEPGDVSRAVIGQALALSSVGGLIGLAGALAFAHLLSNLLFGVGASDPATYVAIMVMLYAVVFCASYFPARRATRVDPVIVLRNE